MKTLFLINLILYISLNSIFCQSIGKLFLLENKLIGDCDDKYFSGFEIELDTIYSRIDSLTLLKQFPRIGTINFKNRIEIPTEFTLTERAGYVQIMFRFKTSYYTFDNLYIDKKSISFTVNNNPEVPATNEDLVIIRIAKQLLSDEKFWNKEDDRDCQDDLINNSFSLYCALRISSLEVEDKYNHRNAVLQKLRHLIEQRYPDKKWNHRLMEFNNMKETKYDDVVDILNEIEQEFMKELNNK